MPVSRLLSAGLLLGAIGLPAVAADASRNETCLTRAEQRAAVDASRAISLAQAFEDAFGRLEPFGATPEANLGIQPNPWPSTTPATRCPDPAGFNAESVS